MIITWTDAYKIGIPMIDEDHQRLVDAVNAFQIAAEAGQDCRSLGSFVDIVITQLTDHFKREETLLDRQDYPDRLTHAAGHKEMLVRLAMFAEPFRKGSLPEGQTTVEKADFLSRLLLAHISEDDPPFKNFLKTLV